MKIRLLPEIRAAFSLFQEKRISRSAAELSYFLTLSIFPFLICLNTMLSNLDISESKTINLWMGVIPEEALKVVNEYLSYLSSNDSTVLFVTGITLLLSSSSAAFGSIINIMADIQGKSRFKGIFGFLITFILSLAFLGVIYLSIIVLLTGGWFMHLLELKLYISGLREAWVWFRFVLLFFLLYGIIYSIYIITEPRQVQRIPRKFGAFLASLLLVGVSALFSWFINLSVSYTLVYGSLASLFILMSWFYTCGIILIFGNVVNIMKNNYRKNEA